jgi:hypothetical protein
MSLFSIFLINITTAQYTKRHKTYAHLLHPLLVFVYHCETTFSSKHLHDLSGFPSQLHIHAIPQWVLCQNTKWTQGHRLFSTRNRKEIQMLAEEVTIWSIYCVCFKMTISLNFLFWFWHTKVQIFQKIIIMYLIVLYIAVLMDGLQCAL